MPLTRLLFAFVAFHVLLPRMIRGDAYTTLPNPQKSPALCHRVRASSVCDPDNILGTESANVIDGLINFIREGSHGFKKGSCGGNQVAVGVVQRIGGTGSKFERVKALAKRLHDEWGVGDKECGNGVVLVLGIEERVMYISTGWGVKDLVGENVIEKIFGQMRLTLRNGKVGPAVEKGVQGIGMALKGEYGNAETGDSGISWVVVLLFFGGVLGLANWRSRKRRGRYEECKKILSKLDKNRRSAWENRYQADSCPICLQDFNADRNGDDAYAGTELLSLRESAGDMDASSVRVLPCGHSFHKECILSWIDASHETCPVCRRSIIQDESDSGVCESRRENLWGWETYRPEHYFRLRRLRYFYPEFISDSMICRWEDQQFRGSLTQDAPFVALDPAVRAVAARSGGTCGSSFSFGGGSSAGGGGHGGSW